MPRVLLILPVQEKGKGLNSNERTSNKFREKLGGSELLGQSRIGEMALLIDILKSAVMSKELEGKLC